MKVVAWVASKVAARADSRVAQRVVAMAVSRAAKMDELKVAAKVEQTAVEMVS